MFCRKCGKEISDDSLFCSGCGERVVTSDIEETAAASPAVSLEKTAENITYTTISANAAADKQSASAVLPEITSQKCYSCGKLVYNNQRSCHNCGAANPGYSSSFDNFENYTLQYNNSSSTAAAVLPQKKTRLKVILISIGALIAVLAVVFFAVILPEMHLDLYYDRDPETGEYIILGTVKDVKEINIPDTIWFIPVRAIDDEAFKNSSVESVSLGKNIRHIGMNAFRNCLELQTVKFSDKMEYDYETGSVKIGAVAFGNCINLKTVQLPNIRTNIYGEAFLNCANLSKINLGNVDMINFRSFVSCASLTEVNTNAELGGSAFEDCISLRSVFLRDVNIPEMCFSGCTALESVHCSYGDGAIQDGAFRNCVNLSTFYVGGDKYNDSEKLQTSEVVVVYANAFENCKSFKFVEPMLKYTPGDFLGMDINDAAEMLGAEYFETSHLEYSSPGLPTFRIVGKPFEYSLEKYYYQITSVTFENDNIWLTKNGSSTDRIHLGMSRDEIYSLVNQAYLESKNLPYEQQAVSEFYDKNNSKEEPLDFYAAGKFYNIYFDSNGISKYCVVGIDWV